MSFMPGMFPGGAATKAFPRVMSQVTSSSPTSSTSHTVDLPSGIVAGELLLIFIASDTAASLSGWTVAAANFISLLWKVATGSEGASVSVTTSSFDRFAAVAYRVSGGKLVESSLVFDPGGNSINPDPPSFSPSWGLDANLWFAAISSHGISVSAANDVSSYPAGYSNGQHPRGDNGFLSVCCGVAERQLATSVEDPGTFTMTAIVGYRAITVAVQPL